MADCKNQSGKKNPNNNNSNSNSKTNPSSLFNRSLTVNSSSSAAAAAAVNNKPSHNFYSTQGLNRNGSIKGFYTSSFGSMVSSGNSFTNKVRKLCSIFESPKQPPPLPNPNPNSQSSPSPSKTQELLSDSANVITKNAPTPVPDSLFRLPGTEDRVVIYFTSLRGIRRTFQDCHSIRMIFRGFRVNIDERDISMDIAYRKELQRVLGESYVGLPQVFIKGKYVGGADVIKHLLEVGELARLVKGLPLRAMKPCDACDDMRFIPCTNCNGSRKVFDEDEDQAMRCVECNENGLVRCPLCCS